MMLKKLRVAFIYLSVIIVSNYAFAQSSTESNIAPVIMLMLEEDPSTSVNREWQGAEVAASADHFTKSQEDYNLVMDGAGNGWLVWKQADGTSPNKFSIWVNYFSAESGWENAQIIETMDFDAETPAIAMNSSGEAIVVWRYEVPVENNGTVWQLWGSHLQRGTNNWNAPMLLEGDSDPEHPQVAMDDNGKALLIWHNGVGLSSRYYDPNTTAWSAAEIFQTTALVDTPPELVMNKNGSAMAVWRENVNFVVEGQGGVTRAIVSGRYFNPNTGWVGESEAISFANETSATSGSITPHLAIDGTGNAIVVWVHNKNRENFTTEFNVWARRYNASSGWENATLLESNDTKFAIIPQVAMNDAGNGMVVWLQKPENPVSGEKSVWANSFTQNNGWSGAQEIEPLVVWQITFPRPRIGIDGEGNAMAVWSKRENSVNRIEATRYNKQNNTWEPKQIIGPNDEQIDNAQFAMNNSGIGLAVWKAGTAFGPDTLKSNHYK